LVYLVLRDGDGLRVVSDNARPSFCYRERRREDNANVRDDEDGYQDFNKAVASGASATD